MATAGEAPQPLAGPEPDLQPVLRALQRAGAAFGYVHGSRSKGSARAGSDLDIAAWFGRPVQSWVVAGELPGGIDLLVLDDAPLELSGRVALHGRLVLDQDPAARVAWEATTRKLYLDEQPRVRQARRDFVQARRRG